MLTAQPGLELERAFVAQGCQLVAGLDEAGRGALAGPVVAGAVVLPICRPDLDAALAGVRDSKLLTPARRAALYDVIVAEAAAAGIGLAGSGEIDRLGIAAATRLAMQRAVEALPCAPQALIIDWVRLPAIPLPQRCLPRAEQHSLSVAAASILAKVTRDRLMTELDARYPGYGFARHKGYGTADHGARLVQLGPCPEHRRTFQPVRARLLEGDDGANRARS